MKGDNNGQAVLCRVQETDYRQQDSEVHHQGGGVSVLFVAVCARMG